MSTEPPVGLGRAFTQHAERLADTPALVCGDERKTFAEVEARANQLGRGLLERGVDAKGLVAIALPNSNRFFEVALACWKIGATPFPLSYRLPERERAALLGLAEPQVVVGAAGLDVDRLVEEAQALDTSPLPDVESRPWKAIGTGGSTGRPKLIIDGAGTPAQAQAGAALFGLGEGVIQLVAGPLYHNGPFAWGAMHLLMGGTLVIMERFDAAGYLELLERERVSWSFVVPTMLHRIAQQPPEMLAGRDLTALRSILHSAAPCPDWLKRRTIEIFGAEKVVEFYGATEVGGTMIRGDEWLAHPGSVGKPGPATIIEIRGDDGRVLAPGDVGEIWVKPPAPPTATYRGAEMRRTDDGFVSVGDLGSLDDDGYLYIADRRADLIISGGANVYPAEVEAALLAHPLIDDVAVIGLGDAEWGQRVHAIVQPAAGATVAGVELDAHCRGQLAAYKVPRSWELVEELPRDPSGKIRRSALRDEREAADA